MKAMLEAILPTLRTGRKVLSRTVPAQVGEGIIAAPLSALQDKYPDVKMGSYPRMGDGAVRTELVLRSPDEARLETATAETFPLVTPPPGSPMAFPVNCGPWVEPLSPDAERP